MKKCKISCKIRILNIKPKIFLKSYPLFFLTRIKIVLTQNNANRIDFQQQKQKYKEIAPHFTHFMEHKNKNLK